MDDGSIEVDGTAVEDWRYDLLIDTLLAFGIAINVYVIVDAATDGQLSRDVRARLQSIRHYARVQWGVIMHREQVIEEAHEALYDEGDS